jgi:hypothetical protein
MLKAGILQ